MFRLVLLSLLINYVRAGYYDGYKLYEVTPHTLSQAIELMSWEQKAGIDFWTQPRAPQAPGQVMVSPEQLYRFQHFLNERNFTWTIKVDDVESIVRAESLKRKYVQPPPPGEYTFHDFHGHLSMNAYLDKLAESYPNDVTVKDEGLSYEKRTIKSILISNKKDTRKKALMVIDCGVHAREWIASTFCMFLIQQLVENNQPYRQMLNVNWLIVPMINPDGYEYTRTKARLWRKTRSASSQDCDGVDGNRNYGYEWGDAGTSDDPCSNIYKGSEPFSEPEIRIMGDIITSAAASHPNSTGYLSFHSYGGLLLYPWGYSDTAEPPPREHQLIRAAKQAVQAVYEQTGLIYKAGNSAQLLYAAAGGSDDFAMGAAGIELSMTVELPPRLYSEGGFELSPNDILPVCRETMHLVRALANFLADNYAP